MQIAGVVYGQDWRQLRTCALSEGYRGAERRVARNTRPNTSGSGAVGAWQFMPGTFASTPFGHLDIGRVDVQAMAAAWMWANGRRNEWSGRGC